MGEKTLGILKVKGSKAWWKYILPLACFILSAYILYHGWQTYTNRSDVGLTEVVIGWVFFALVCAVPGVVFGMVEDYYFDFMTGRYKLVKRVGFIGFGKWKKFKNLEYVSIFQNVEGDYAVNLWYDRNKHFDLREFFYKNDALSYASELAISLSIELHNSLEKQGMMVADEVANQISETDRKIDAHFSQGKLPFWRKIMAALFLTAGLTIVYYFFIGIDVEHQRMEMHPFILQIPFILISVGLSLSIVNDYVFDIENKQFRIIHNIGPFRWGKWKHLRSLDYISVYGKKAGQFQINLWYNKNKHLTFYILADYEDAVKAGKILASELNVALLDASNPRDTKWLDI